MAKKQNVSSVPNREKAEKTKNAPTEPSAQNESRAKPKRARKMEKGKTLPAAPLDKKQRRDYGVPNSNGRARVKNGGSGNPTRRTPERNAPSKKGKKKMSRMNVSGVNQGLKLAVEKGYQRGKTDAEREFLATCVSDEEAVRIILAKTEEILQAKYGAQPPNPTVTPQAPPAPQPAPAPPTPAIPITV